MHGLTQEHARLALSDGWSQETLKALHEQIRGMTGRMPEAYRMGVRYIAPFAFMVLGRLVYRGASYAQIRAVLRWTRPSTVQVHAYTDGSGTTKERPAGIGVAVYWPDRTELIAENIGTGTNNRAELCAIWRALRAAPDVDQALLIHSDSEYAIGALTQDWQRNKNAALIEQIRRDLALRHAVALKHVEGHAGHEGNEVADQLAKVGRKLVTQVTEYPDD